MAKQMRIPNTGRPGIPEVLEEACEEVLERRRDKRRVTKDASDKLKTSMWKVLTLMGEHKIPKCNVTDPETEEVLEFDLEQVVRIRKTGEVASEEGAEDDVISTSNPNGGVHPGLIAQAEAAQAEAGVAEDSEGDVVPLESSAKKTKAKKSGRKKS